jgi:Protein of unknown function, DUF481
MRCTRAWVLAVFWPAGPRWAHALLAGLFLLSGGGVLEAQKADSVWIRNGDRITGEVEALSRGLLEYSTDDLGTIYIEWDKVVRISTTTLVEVRLSSGEKFYGHLQPASTGWLTLGGESLPLNEIVAMQPINQTFLGRLSGYLDLGFSYQKANQTVQLTTGAQVRYRAPTTETAFQFSTFLEDREDADLTSRLASSLTGRLLLSNHWSTGVAVGYDINEELDLAGRGRLVAFAARTLVQSNHIELFLTGGTLVTRERYFSTDSSSTGWEGLVGASFRAFRHDQPKLDVVVTTQVYPSFTVGGRVRMQHDLRVSYELVKDFMLTTTVFDAYDSKPPTEDAPTNDFGTTLSITWTF